MKKNFKRVLAYLLVSVMLITGIPVQPLTAQVSPSTVETLLQEMTTEQKAAQMIQPNLSTVTPEQVKQYQLGSVLSGGGEPPASGNSMKNWADAIDAYNQAAIEGTSASEHGTAIPLLYGVDAVHGHNNVYGATVFPHNIGLGATNDAELVKQIGAATASEVRATGANWAFTPLLGVPHNERWGRTYEAFGDDPEVVAAMGTAYVEGIQGNGSAAATAKHYIGEGLIANGINQGNVVMDDATYQKLIQADMSDPMVKELLTPYKEAIDAGVMTIMASYNSFNGVKCHGNKELLTDLLKDRLGFGGIVITDYNGVDQIGEVSGYANQVVYAVNAGVDMLMVAGYNGNTPKWQTAYHAIVDGVENGKISEERLDDAARRILTVKDELGLLDEPDRAYADVADQAAYGGEEHRAIARKAVAESLVLLKNDEVAENTTIMNALADYKNVVVAGSGANNIGKQCGGWTISWQGSTGKITEGTTIYEGIQSAVKENGGKATFSANGYYEHDADVAVVVVGENPYAESNGDSAAAALKLNTADAATIKTIKADHPDTPIVLVLITGRPLGIMDYVNDAQVKGIVSAWLPGTEGAGVADVLFGDQDFTGKNPITWPYYPQDIENKRMDESKVLYQTGYGLTKDEVTEFGEAPEDPTVLKFNTTTGAVTKLEAETFCDKYEAADTIILENGGTTVGNLRNGSYLLYKIASDKNMAYHLVLNANANTAQANAFQLYVDDMLILDNTMTVPAQGNWTTFAPLDLGDVSIPAGDHTLKLLAKTKDFNLDWFEFTALTENEYTEPKAPEPVVPGNNVGTGALLEAGAVQVTTSSAENSGNDWYHGNKRIDNKVEERDPLDIRAVDDVPMTTITVDNNTEYNTFLGMGTSVDESTIHNLWKMSEENRYGFIKKLVDPEAGSGMTLFRLTIGTPDFVACPFYTYYDGKGTELNGKPDWYNETGNGFSIQKDVDYHIIDTIKLIQQVAADCGVEDQIKFFASPWTPPGWMKEQTNSSRGYKNNGLLLKGGKLSDAHIEDAAKYYVRYIEEYQKLGIPVYAMTLQNEPMLEIDYPSCSISAAQEAKLAAAIKKELAASTILSDEEKDVKIWAFDHNPGDLNTYMRTVYGAALDSVDGAAVHDYGGELSNMTTLHNNYTDKSIHLTERSVWGTTGMDRIVQYFRNYAESYNCWVTMLDSNIQTHQWVGTPDVTAFVQDATEPDNYWATPEVYLMAQFTKYIRPGFVRVQSNYGSSSTITNVVFKNPETGELIMVAVNNTNQPQNFKVVNNGIQFNATLEAKNCATYRWMGSTGEVQGLSIPGTLSPKDAKTVSGMDANDNFENVTAGASASWLVEVKESGWYNVSIPHAVGPTSGPSVTSNTEDKNLVLKADNGDMLGKTVTKRFDTWSSDWNAWGTYRNVQMQVYLEKGTQNLAIVSEQDSINIGTLTFEKAKENNVPGYIPALNYSYGDKVIAENGTNIGFFDDGDSVSYRINVQADGTYRMKLNYGVAEDPAALTFKIDDGEVQTAVLAPTGGWSVWADSEGIPVELAAGEHTITFVDGGFNFNGFSFGAYITLSADELTEGALDGKAVTVKITDSTFADEWNKENWTLENLPEGIDFDLNRVSDTEVEVTLKGAETEDYDTDREVTVVIKAEEIGERAEYVLKDAFTITAVNDPESLGAIDDVAYDAESFDITIAGGKFVSDITPADIVLSDNLSNYVSVADVTAVGNTATVTIQHVKPNYEDIRGIVAVKAGGYTDGTTDLETEAVFKATTEAPTPIEFVDGVALLSEAKAYRNNGTLTDGVKGSYVDYYMNVPETGDYILSMDVTNNEEIFNALKLSGGLGYKTDNLGSISFGKYWNNTNVSYRAVVHLEKGENTLRLEANAAGNIITNTQLSVLPDPTVIGNDAVVGADTTIGGATEQLWALEGHNNIGYTGTGAYQNYLVNVEKAGTYTVKIRYATEGTDSTAALLNAAGEELGSVALNSTGAWAVYRDSDEFEVKLSKGEQILSLLIKTGGFNYQNIQFTQKEEEVVPVTEIFEDVQSGEWFEDGVQYVYDHGYMKGISDTKFAPGDHLQRAQFATILYRIEKEPGVEFKNIYPDVADGEYYSDAVIWASGDNVNVITGYIGGPDSGKFGPAHWITREQLVTMLYRYAKYKGCDISENSAMEAFQDKDEVSEYAKEAMGWAVAKGLIKGDDGRLNPQGNATRAECAVIIQRFMNNVE